MTTYRKKNTSQLDPAKYPPGDLPQVTQETLRAIADKKVKTSEDLALLLTEGGRAERKKGYYGRNQTAGDDERQGSAVGTVAIVRPVIESLAQAGVKRVKQLTEFSSKGAGKNKLKGEANRQAVLDAAKATLAERTRKPSWRELAILVAERTNLPPNTVRGHISKLREDKSLD